MKTAITPDITIEELTTIYPVTVKYLSDKGIRCIICGEPIWGSLQEAALEKGYSNGDVEELVEDLILFIKNND